VNDNDRMIDKIRKLLALAGAESATEGERDNAMRMAHGLMAKHNIEMSQIDQALRNREDPREQQNDTFYGRPWARQVAAASAKLFFCEYLYRAASKGKDTHHTFIGRRSNAITAMELAKYLVQSIEKESRKLARANYWGNGERRSFALGAASAIRARVLKIIADSTSVETAPGTALVLANLYQVEKVENDKALALWYPKLRKGKGGKAATSGEAYASGHAYGKTVSLQRQVSARSSGALK
jgi:hypothetical protein